MRSLFLAALGLAAAATSARAGSPVLCYGDSIAFETCPVLAAMRPDLDVVNAGLPSDRSSNFARFRDAVRANAPDVVVLFGTTNDVAPFAGGDPAYPPRRTARNLLRMARFAKRYAARVLMLTPTPVILPNPLHVEREAHAVAVAHELVHRTFHMRRVILLDALALFSPTGWTSPPFDGLHPDAAAQSAIATLVADAIP